eukprot:2932040-Prymnesium_polylepis.1
MRRLPSEGQRKLLARGSARSWACARACGVQPVAFHRRPGSIPHAPALRSDGDCRLLHVGHVVVARPGGHNRPDDADHHAAAAAATAAAALARRF